MSGDEMDTLVPPSAPQATPATDDGFVVQRARKARKRAKVDGSVSDDSTASAATLRQNTTPDPPPKPVKVPPIILTGPCPNWQRFLKELKQDGRQFEAKFVNRDIHLLCPDIPHFRRLQNQLEVSRIPFHTFSLPSEREVKVTIKGLPDDTPPDDILQELVSEGFTPVTASPLRRREEGGRVPSLTFFVKLRRVGSWQKIFHTTSLLGVKVVVGEFTPQRGAPQCYRCQGFWHSSSNCHLPPRCLKCAGPHISNTCGKPYDVPPTCCNCNGDHVASWRGCPAHKQAAASRGSKKPPLLSKEPPHRRAPTTSRAAPASRPPPSATGNKYALLQEPADGGAPAPPPQEGFPSLPQMPPPPATTRPPRKVRRRHSPPSDTAATETDLESDAVSSYASVARPRRPPRPRTSRPVGEAPTPRLQDSVPPPPPHTGVDSVITTNTLLRWLASILPLLASPDMTPTEVIRTILSSLHDLLSHGSAN